ncbi:Ger(x)C family spore germination protein [Alicyclobacillus fastidiosus]|uniref:Ger(X)C family spore germination protein n=1 Tax=Alicyclobacillus fastidiosus TaxID=392011 RepID=A0ABY6ZBQ9_9BACL|nr:Ger(x)C family spore germination protein [Alicyclobacillus fastidiosus]WAH40284.1 Ger(x)C family spore germination protein [Alicyclobacillus fastidiosus]GMA61661.1 hypothetical protein GCM10025859_21010 [Alicyclobacillus fastidiosus]
MKKLVQGLLMLFLCMILTGCWDRNEVKDLALVMATGIDKSEQGGIRVTDQIAVPSAVGGGQLGGGSKEQKSFVIESAEGKDISDASQKLQDRLPRLLYSAHRRILIIGEEQARDGIQDILDTYSRDTRNRLRNLIVVAKGDTAESVLQSKTILEQIPGQELKKLQDRDFGTKTTMLEFLNEMATEGIVPIAGGIEKRTSGDQKYWLSSTAVFKHGKLVGYLDEEETRGLLWVKGKIQHAYVTADNLPNNKGTVSMYVTSASSHIRYAVTGRTITFNIDLTGQGEIVENTANLDFRREKSLSMVNKELNKAVMSYATACIDTAQKDLKADVFGLGEEIYRNNPRLWHEIGPRWDERFPDVKVYVHVHLNAMGPGTTGGPIRSEGEAGG